MADMMQFDLVSPERLLSSVQASAVRIPGEDGDFTAMPDHAPTIATIRPGIVVVTGAKGEQKYVVTGGFAEVSQEGTSVLAERAISVEDVTQDVLDEFIAAAVIAREHATPEMLDALAKHVADIAAVAAELGFQANEG